MSSLATLRPVPPARALRRAAARTNITADPTLSHTLAPQFSLLSGFISWLFSKDELKVLMVGLDYAGKTTLLERIKHAYAPAYRGIALDAIPPTIGMNLATVTTP